MSDRASNFSPKAGDQLAEDTTTQDHLMSSARRRITGSEARAQGGRVGVRTERGHVCGRFRRRKLEWQVAPYTSTHGISSGMTNGSGGRRDYEDRIDTWTQAAGLVLQTRR